MADLALRDRTTTTLLRQSSQSGVFIVRVEWMGPNQLNSGQICLQRNSTPDPILSLAIR